MEISKIMGKPVNILIAVVMVLLIFGVIYLASNNTPQVVAAGDNISVYYTGTLTNGTVFDSNVGKSPLNFTVGSGQLIAGFDNAVIGMKLNETKTVTLLPSEAYGEVNQSLIVQVSRYTFGNKSINVGMAVQTTNGQRGVITAISGKNVTVDFNPPLAGQTLIFTIKVVKIKK